ncbi:MAG: hypothetical protein DRJ65_22110, partial [Acidobacteria bacterium]
MTRHSICIMTILLLFATASAAVVPIEVEVVIEDRARLDALSWEVSVTDFVNGIATVVCSPAQIDRLRDLGYQLSVIKRPKFTGITMCPTGWENLGTPSWDCYPTYAQYEAMMHRLAESFPTLCRFHDLGPSANLTKDHRLLALEISDNPDIDEAEPEVFLTSTMHGDETAGYVTMLRLAFDLLNQYGSDVPITDLVDQTEIWINPLANPDGTYFGGDDTVRSAIRFLTTADGQVSWVNANRNFPDPRYGSHPHGDPWWPETVAMMDLAESRHFVLSANIHSGAELINYPWDTWCDRHPDDEWFFDLSLAWATAAQEDGPSGYMDDCRQPGCFGGTCTPGVTNGADWYMVAGGRQDFMTYFHGGREVTVEISSTKLLPSEQLPTIWTANRRALLNFIDAAQHGIHGTVIDADNGNPVSAMIEIIGLDSVEARSSVKTDTAAGDFHRLLNPGLYDLRISAMGRRTVILFDVEVPNDGPSV